MSTINEIEKILRSQFDVTYLKLIDDSQRHATHSETKKHAGGHFQLIMVSKTFIGMPQLQRQRLIHTALKTLFKDKIHALSLKLYTPNEF